jgi:hypothetical protein
VQAIGIELVNPRTRITHTLGYPESAIWDMASRGYDLDRIATALAVTARLTLVHARLLVVDTLEALEAKGFVTSETEGG